MRAALADAAPSDAAMPSDGRATITDVPRWGSEPPLVGRGEELRRLVELLAVARGGQAAACLLAGDAGVGKTRLLVELARRATADGVPVFTGHCVDLGEVGLPYLPVTDILRGVAAAAPDISWQTRYPALAPLLGGPGAGALAPATAEAATQLYLFDAVAEVIGELSAQRPLLLVIEDLHWADQSTRDLLRYLLSRLDRQPVLVVGSYRTDDLHRRHPLRPLLAELARLPLVERIQLAPLADVDMAALVRFLQDDAPLADEDVTRIVGRAEGNAFYAEQLLQARQDGDREPLPGALADVLLTRLEQLPAAAQRVVRTAAVAGRRVQHGLLLEATGLGDAELDAALREAVTRHVLVPVDGQAYAFRHALLREAAYSDLLPGERVRTHARFAELLDSGERWPGWAAELAYHRRESHDLPGALTAALEAADEARRLGAPAEQLQHLQGALTLWPAVSDPAALTGRDEVSLMLSASTAAVQAGEPQRAVALTRAALNRVDAPADLELTARVRYTLAQNLIDMDLDQAAYAETTAALDLLPADPPTAARTWAAATHVRTAWFVGDEEGARRAGTEALAAADRLGLDAAWADAMISLTRMDVRTGDPTAVLERLEEAHRRAERAGDDAVLNRVLFVLAASRYESGDLAGALRWLDSGLEHAGAHGGGWSPFAAEMRHLQVVIRYAAGDWDGSLRAAEQAAGSAPASAEHVAVAGLFVAVGRGLPEAGAKVAEAMLARRGNPMWMLTAGSCAVEHAGWTRPDAAPALAQAAVEAISRQWGPEVLGFVRLFALTLGAIGDLAQTARLVGATTADLLAQGRPLVERSRELAAGSVAARGPLGIEAAAWLARVEAEWSRAEGSDAAQGVELWRESIAAFGYGHVYEQARGRWRLAEALLCAGDKRAAALEVRAAYDVAVRLGAHPLADALVALARRGRLAAGLPGAAAGSTASPLTPREREVVALLTRGRTNRQIGRELYISEKTASVHVSNILAKLGASGRTEAVGIAHRRGLVDDEGI